MTTDANGEQLINPLAEAYEEGFESGVAGEYIESRLASSAGIREELRALSAFVESAFVDGVDPDSVYESAIETVQTSAARSRSMRYNPNNASAYSTYLDDFTDGMVAVGAYHRDTRFLDLAFAAIDEEQSVVSASAASRNSGLGFKYDPYYAFRNAFLDNEGARTWLQEDLAVAEHVQQSASLLLSPARQALLSHQLYDLTGNERYQDSATEVIHKIATTRPSRTEDAFDDIEQLRDIIDSGEANERSADESGDQKPTLAEMVYSATGQDEDLRRLLDLHSERVHSLIEVGDRKLPLVPHNVLEDILSNRLSPETNSASIDRATQQSVVMAVRSMFSILQNTETRTLVDDEEGPVFDVSMENGLRQFSGEVVSWADKQPLSSDLRIELAATVANLYVLPRLHNPEIWDSLDTGEQERVLAVDSYLDTVRGLHEPHMLPSSA